MFRISQFINDESFQMVFTNNTLDIINYSNINYMEDDKISLCYRDKKLLIKGSDLRVKKLLESEIMVGGNISSIEFIK